VPPPATRTSVPALAQVVKASGWTVRVPSTWRARPAGAVTSADVSCVGTDEQPCLLRLAAGLDASAPPRFGVLGGGVLPGFSAGGCRQAGRGSELDVGDDTAPLFGWTCGSERYEQVTLQPRMLLAVARTGGGPIAPAVLRTLRRDPTYVHDYVVNACPDVPFGANGDGLASDVRAGGQICAGAASLVLELHTLTGPASGPAAVSRRGWRCSVVRTDGDLPSSAVTCRVADGMSVSWTQN
jgi:hypothetical protein